MAYSILEFSPETVHPSIHDIRAQYRLCALKYHPDKCKLPDANSRFCKIQEAYSHLMLIHKTHSDEETEMDDNTPDTGSDYSTLLKSYMSSFFSNMRDPDINQKLAMLAISKLLGLCEKRAAEYARKLDCETLAKIYDMMYKYKDAFHLSEQWLEIVNQILTEKMRDKQCVVLNPFLEDLQADNLYKISENGQTYIVPLWHPELIYDNNGADFIVHCCPVLPEHMEIDEHNNIYVHLTYSLLELWETPTVTVPFGNAPLSFSPSALFLSRKPQTICIPNAGISRINQKNMFDNTSRSNVMLVITIV
jgi:hypothetical protein